ncbi:MAG: S1-like domain-containing RNA-binding protein [Brumimicrobium sp.]
MSYIGRYSTLKIDRFTSVGAYLTDNNDFEVLLPNKYLNDNLELGQEVKVFIYNDSEDRPVATTEIPYIELNKFAFLKVKDVNNYGAFLDWGLEKDLLVPFKEQNSKMIVGNSYTVALLLDEQTNRLIGTAKINKLLSDEVKGIEQGDKVEIYIASKTELGYKVIVNEEYAGLIFNNRVIKDLNLGEITDGYVEFIREDGKLDISLVPISEEKFDLFTEKVLDYIKKNDGVIHITDKSDPEIIRSELEMSKKSFKKAIGNLYKSRKIVINKDSIEMV